MPDSNISKAHRKRFKNSRSNAQPTNAHDDIGVEKSPVFIHSLWRSGSTYFFQAFRRSSAGYWCYQEPIHEEALLRANDPEGLLKSDNELAKLLRHPELDQPYYQELFETHSSWQRLIEKPIIYDEYFCSKCSDAMFRYLKALISASRGRPVIQECRTSNRIGAVKSAVGGMHLYLWRNPWDQWWSFKCAEYFDVVAQLIVNAPNNLPVIAKLRAEIGFVEFHSDNIIDEMKYFEMRRLTSDDSYLVFFVLWCLALLEARQHADICLNIDQITESLDYRTTILAKLNQLGISGISLDDCKIHRTAFALQDRYFFQRNEDRAFGVLLSSGISNVDLDALRSARQEAIPNDQLNLLDAAFLGGALIDAVRAREIVLRIENASVSRIRYLLQEWGHSVANEVSLRQQNLATQRMLELALSEMAESKEALTTECSLRLEAAELTANSRLSEVTAREQEANQRLAGLMGSMQALVAALQVEKHQLLEAERTRADGREIILQREIEAFRLLLNELRGREERLRDELSTSLMSAKNEIETRYVELIKSERGANEREVEIFKSQTSEKIQMLKDQLTNTKNLHRDLQAEALSLQTELANAREEINVIVNGWPWKLTAPFRWLFKTCSGIQAKQKTTLLKNESLGLHLKIEPEETTTKIINNLNDSQASNVSWGDCEIESKKCISNCTPSENSANMGKNISELLDLHGAAFVSAAYRMLLGRSPDSQGMRYYLSRLASGYSKFSVIYQITQSKEARNLIDIGGMPQLDDDAFIAAVYRALLKREPDPEGLSYYRKRLQSGKPRHFIVSDIKKSPEGRTRGLLSPELNILCEQERKANHWFWGRFSRINRLEQKINRLGYEIGHGTQRLIALAQQSQVQVEAQSERTKFLFNSLQGQMTQVKENVKDSFSNSNNDYSSLQDVGSIPKILHRVYFENYSPYYDPFLHYLETWKRELPNYKIMKWGHQNVNTLANNWLRRSADASDPVFLSEFIRWDVLKTHGGIYLDSDCEVLNGEKFDSLVEELMNSTEYDAFVGVEEFYNGHPTAQTVAAKKGAALVEFMYDMYTNALSGTLWHWRAERGLIGPQLMSLYFLEHGLTETKGFPVQLKEPIIVGRVKIYPQEYFSPKFTTTGKKLALTENTCIYHLFANLNVKDVDPEAEKHRRSPLLFNEYCDYLSKLDTGKTVVEAFEDIEASVGQVLVKDTGIRKLHRIYFGFDGKPDPYRRYLDTWVKQMPGYEICHWDSNNLPLDNCQFSRMMHEFKDHAFLSDYFRWWILREHGGIYLDADVEITNGQLLDKLITELDDDESIHSFIGIDSKADGWYTAHSMACKKDSKLARFMCEVYEGLGHVSLWRRKIFYFMAPQMTSMYFAKHGWNVDGMGSSPNLHTPSVIEGVKIYPQEWFSPMRPQMRDGIGGFEIDSYTENTCICHHFSCSWHTDDSPYKSKLNDEKKFLLLDELANLDCQWR